MVTTYFADVLGLGTTELIVILVILVLLFGAKKLPELARSIGSSAKELKTSMKDEPTKQSDKPDNLNQSAGDNVDKPKA